MTESTLMDHVLPKLPYPKDALTPYMSSETLDFHYGKHHLAYVETLNKLIKGTEFADLPLEGIIKAAPPGPVFNNAAQVWNHSFFWHSMKPGSQGAASGALADAIQAKWGSASDFRKAFLASATANFGSGWTWLVKTANGSLDIRNTTGAATPVSGIDKPLLTLDVWEHAYYIDYRNRRPVFIEAFLDHLANWEFAAANFA
jgi:Fe-Mn family superoxide dismutase